MALAEKPQSAAASSHPAQALVWLLPAPRQEKPESEAPHSRHLSGLGAHKGTYHPGMQRAALRLLQFK